MKTFKLKRSTQASALYDPAFIILGFIAFILAIIIFSGEALPFKINLSEALETHLENALKLTLACMVGSFIGLERGNKNRPAGIRTNALVCVGSALIMIISFDIFFKYNHLANFDPARLGAQVVTGVGFLGAGTIMRNGTNIKGLTTAAGLWVVASLGLAIGAGLYIEATLAFMLVYFTLHQLSNMEQRQNLKRIQVEFFIISKDKAGQIGAIGQALGKKGVRITNLMMERDDDAHFEDHEIDETELCLHLHTRLPKGVRGIDLQRDLETLDGIVSVEYKYITDII